MTYNIPMDMKKKLEDKYLPDKEARRTRVLVALSGGLNSFVMAYLLKIQKYELVAVTVVLNWEESKSESSKILSCQLDASKLESIKEFCHQLGIPHHVVQASDDFKEEVVESWLASQITGTKSNQCWSCHDLRMRFIHKKMVELSAEYLATGHLAKIFRQESHHSVYVHTSSDEANDQSALLSRLPHEILDKLMLPLSDLQQKEINKLAENFGLSSIPKLLNMHSCFNIPYTEGNFLEKLIPAKFLMHGDIVDADQSSIGTHYGIQRYKFGEIVSLSNQNSKKPLRFAKFILSEKKIELQPEEYFLRESLILKKCKFSEETSLAEPLRGVVKFGESDYVDCWIYPKNFSCVYLVLDAPAKILEGQIISVLKKRGKNAKVYLTGQVQYVPRPKAEAWDGKKVVKVDYDLDF